MTWFNDVFSWLGTHLSALWAQAEPEAVKIFKLFVSTFEKEAVDAVVAEAQKTISGQEKFDNAVAVVSAIVVAAGWKASTTALETLIQDAYLSWKASQGASLVTPPSA